LVKLLVLGVIASAIQKRADRIALGSGGRSQPGAPE